MNKIGKKVKEILENEEFVRHRPLTKLTPGQAIRIYREKQGMTQEELAKAAKLTQATISSLEHDRITLGLDRARALARALKVHPAVLAFPDWESEAA